MKNLHRALMGVMSIALLAAAVGVSHPSGLTALAQHGQHGGGQDAATDLHEHFAAVVEHLELTDAQHETLAQPLTDAFMAMQELHRLHGVIAAELTEEQQHKFASAIHGMMGGGMGEHSEHDADAGHGERHREQRNPGARH